LCGGLIVLFFVAPFSLLAVFYSARAFNQDVSKWNTSAVTNMYYSKCTLSLSPSVFSVWYMYNSRFVGSQFSHVLFCFFFVWFETGPLLFVVVCVVGLVFLFFVAPFSLLAVFCLAYAFNHDVSKWNTSAVTTMEQSKFTLSLSLCGHGAFRCGVLLKIYDISRFVGSHVSHVLFLFLVVV
jgi:surface protein